MIYIADALTFRLVQKDVLPVFSPDLLEVVGDSSLHQVDVARNADYCSSPLLAQKR